MKPGVKEMTPSTGPSPPASHRLAASSAAGGHAGPVLTLASVRRSGGSWYWYGGPTWAGGTSAWGRPLVQFSMAS